MSNLTYTNPSICTRNQSDKPARHREEEAVTEEELARGLASLGYRVEDEEMRQLAEQVGAAGPGGVRKSAFVASQLDWPALQSDFRCGLVTSAIWTGHARASVRVELHTPVPATGRYYVPETVCLKKQHCSLLARRHEWLMLLDESSPGTLAQAHIW